MIEVLPARVRVQSQWTVEDRWGAVRCRLGRFRMRYRVAPGLYALGMADADSPVVVTANYKLSFDLVRRDLRDAACWILALDTGGLGVWCAAAAGTFSTEELVARISRERLSSAVRHREIILPQLGAGAVDAALVLAHTGFHVRAGPVRSSDLPAYLRAGEASAEMRAVRFTTADRVAQTPIELGRSLKMFAVFVLGAFLYAGWTPAGVLFDKGWSGAWPLYTLGLGAVASGSFLVPLLLPWIPFRPLSVKGWIVGAVVSVVLVAGARRAGAMNALEIAASLLFFPGASAYLSSLFAESVPAGHSGSRPRRGRVFPLVLGAVCCLAAVLFVLSKLSRWGLLRAAALAPFVR